MRAMTTSTETRSYQGGCHCGKVRYEVAMQLTGGMTCNCSICSKTGTVLTFVPDTQFKLLAGEDSLTDYQFGKQRLHHLFCKRCGIRSFARGSKPDGTAMVAVNIRSLDDIDLAAVPTQQFDGKKL
jgi:hypothetical protein